MYAKLPEDRQDLFQWDTGQYMLVSDDVDRIDFMFRNTRNIVYGVFSEDGRVPIPDVILHTSGVMDALIMVGSNGVYTLERMEIPIIERPMPPGYVMTPRGQIVTYDDFSSVLGKFDLLQKTGGTMSGDIDMDEFMVRNLDDAEEPGDAVSKHFADFRYVQLGGSTMTGRLKGMQYPVSDDEAANKRYVDEKVKAAQDGAEDTSKAYVDSKWHSKDVTISAEWAGDSEPYTNEVEVEDLLATDLHFIDLRASSNWSEAEAQTYGYAMIFKVEAIDGKIKLYAAYKPEVALPVTIRFRRA